MQKIERLKADIIEQVNSSHDEDILELIIKLLISENEEFQAAA